MEHTYLRYECTDSFGITTATPSSKAPQSNSILAFLATPQKSIPTLLTTAGSYCVGWNLKTNQQIIRLGHREHLTGGVGTGRALNSDEVVCLDVLYQEESQSAKVASGWVDGGVRIFDLTTEDLRRSDRGLTHSLIYDNKDEDFIQREPLVLNGHGESPVRTVRFEIQGKGRLASGGSDGAVVLWDIVSETGIFRLIGHRGGITDISFASVDGVDALITSSLDGLVKVWDLDAQRCTQTIASHRGEVLTASCMNIRAPTDEADRLRLVTGGQDGQVRVWSVETPSRLRAVNQQDDSDEKADDSNQDDVCNFTGYLVPPENIAKSSEKVVTIRYHPSARYLGVLQANAKAIDVYIIRNMMETEKKRQRRLRRRQEKAKKQSSETGETSKGRKRGLLDDDDHSDKEDEVDTTRNDGMVNPEEIKATDEFEWIASVRCNHKIKSFSFSPQKEKGELLRLVCALATNAMETHRVYRSKNTTNTGPGPILTEKVAAADIYGHPTGIRSISLSSDDGLVCTVSKNSTKIWNAQTRSLIQSLVPSIPESKSKNGCYGLCSAFLPGNDHVVIGTREGHLLIVDISSGDVIFAEESAHDGAVWSIDIRRPSASDNSVAMVTGSADKSVKFWSVEEEDEENDQISSPVLILKRQLQMSDDVVGVRYSHALDASKRLVFVASLDSTIKVFFDDSLKLFLSLYGHKLPVLAVDASDDDMLLASGGADKTVKIWGLDFGDTHRTLHGHQDSITDVRFVRRTHNFFTSSKDGTIRFWDADRFQQILLLQGHTAEVNCLVVNKTGAFLLSGSMDRQIRVWERTKDIVFLEEERERELEQVFDKVNNRTDTRTSDILDSKDDDEEGDGDEPQSEAAVRKSITSISAGDRLMEAIEQADQELKEIQIFKKNNPGKIRAQNPMMFGLEPHQYVLWILKTIKVAELEQSVLMLPMRHIERLLYYLIILLKGGRGIELCARIGVYIVKIHQNQVVAAPSLATPLRELLRLIQLRLRQVRDDVVGYNLAALRLVGKTAAAQKQANFFGPPESDQDIWAGMGLGSDLAAAIQGRPTKK